MTTDPVVIDAFEDVYGGSPLRSLVEYALEELGYPNAAQLRYMLEQARCKCDGEEQDQ